MTNCDVAAESTSPNPSATAADFLNATARYLNSTQVRVHLPVVVVRDIDESVLQGNQRKQKYKATRMLEEDDTEKEQGAKKARYGDSGAPHDIEPSSDSSSSGAADNDNDSSSNTSDDDEDGAQRNNSLRRVDHHKQNNSKDVGTDMTTSSSSSSSAQAIMATRPAPSFFHRGATTNIITLSPSLPLILPSPDGCNDMDPDEFLLQLITALCPHVHLEVKAARTLTDFFPTVLPEQMIAYNTDIVQITRCNDITALREYSQTYGRDALNCYNRFGEGLLNMACRRGFTDIVHFLLSNEVQLSVRVRDDGGRTPFHDACWYPEPQIQVCSWIVQQDPSLLLIADHRGYTPFQYARKCDWPIWRKFLTQNLDAIRYLGSDPDIVKRFSKCRVL
jgi:hypothetical protein